MWMMKGASWSEFLSAVKKTHKKVFNMCQSESEFNYSLINQVLQQSRVGLIHRLTQHDVYNSSLIRLISASTGCLQPQCECVCVISEADNELVKPGQLFINTDTHTHSPIIVL